MWKSFVQPRGVSQVRDPKEPFSQPGETLPGPVSLLNLWDVFPDEREEWNRALTSARRDFTEPRFG